MCPKCHALYWYDERCRRESRVGSPVYNPCCRGGKVVLDNLNPTPSPLSELLDPLGGPDSRHFLDNIRMYNSMFAFTSMGVQVDERINAGNAPYVFRVSGQLCHLIGSLLPLDDEPPRFAQLYMYDTQNEISNRLGLFSTDDSLSAPRSHIVQALSAMLGQHNCYVQAFRSVRERILADPDDNLHLRIVAHRSGDGRQYAAPAASEVVGLVVGDLDTTHHDRDIIVQRRSGLLQRISSLHPSYMPFQYPLVFAHGEDGFHLNIEYSTTAPSTSSSVRQHVTMNEYYCYRLHVRAIGCNILLKCSRLLQQIAVDMYACVEQSRLSFVRANQATLRSETYNNVRNAVVNSDMFGDTIGRRVILPASHVDSPRYMFQNYQDAVAICKHLGTPHLFITFTSNPAWPEITRNLFPGQRAADRPDLVCRVFRMKLNLMVRDFRDGRFFGPVSACRDRDRIAIHRNSNPNMPAVEHQNNQNQIVDEHLANNPVSRCTKLTAWFELNAIDPFAHSLTYSQVTKYYTWHEDEKVWRYRLQGDRLARMHFVHPTAGDVYYVRMLLNYVHGASSFQHLRTSNGVLYPTFKEACNALGLLNNNTEWVATMQDAAAMASSPQLRCLFVNILLFSEIADASEL
ncbi:hypothetical protein LUZ63_003680 [Rhynchospora breviuscula]|uniref:Helitron helicase-like domain-containing protein n=1 Tax=Rhynchospora breviuscula TaxID=2022672 RepID=A0A9Q0HZ83_9POAL|nr:hypothetical protein LUZ63_003680 [Rhynchospora breviuscula]